MKFFSLAILAFMLLLSSCGSDGTTIAEMGDIKIERDAFVELLKTRFRTDDLSSIEYDDKVAVLHQLLDQHRKVLAAKEMGLDQDPVYLKERKQTTNRFLAMALYEDKVTRVLVPESDIRQYYDWQQARIEAVVIKTGHESARVFKADRTKEEALALSKEHVAALASSEKPLETAAALTEDKRNKSHLDPYLLGRLTAEVDAAVYQAKVSETIGPIDTEFGYYVLKILSRRPEPNGQSYEQARERIEKTLMARKRGKEEKGLFNKVTEELKEANQVTYLDDNMAAFAAGLVTWGEDPESELADFPDTLRSLELGRVGDETFTGQEVVDNFGPSLKRDYKKFSSATRLKELFVEPQFNLLTWAYAARTAGLDASSAVRMQTDNFTRNRLSQLFEKEAINSTLQVTNAMIEEQYNAHPEKYTVADRIRIWKISVKDKAIAEEIAAKAKSGVTFEQLAKSYEHQGSKKSTEFNMGYQTRKSKRSEIVNKAFEAGANKTIGPFFIEDYYTVIKTGDYVGPILQPLKKVKSTIRNELANAQKAERTKEILEEIRVKYVHKINESLLRSLS